MREVSGGQGPVPDRGGPADRAAGSRAGGRARVSRSWLYKLLARYSRQGPAGLAPRSRRPHHSPARIAHRWEEEIIALRRELQAAGFDAGAATIAAHLGQRHQHPPSASTIWRVLKAGGFVTPQPHKRPKSSYVRFTAELPNQCWQADITPRHRRRRQLA